MLPVTSLYSYVNRWECDENDHMNVQFYLAKFDEADRHFFSNFSGEHQTLGSRLARHIRYHHEAHDATILCVSTGVCFDSPYEFTVIHQMNDYSNGTLLATALDGYALGARFRSNIQSKFKKYQISPLDTHLPRGFDCSMTKVRLGEQNLLDQGAFVVHHNTLMPRNCGPNNLADDHFIVGCFSDGAAHMWERTPLNRAWLDQQEYGRVALEMKLSYQKPLKIGSSIKLVSGLTNVSAKTFTFRHHMFDTKSNKLVLTGDIVATVLDLNCRQAVNLPEKSIENMKKLLIE